MPMTPPPGRREVTAMQSNAPVRRPDEPTERFRAVVTAAEAILELATEP